MTYEIERDTPLPPVRGQGHNMPPDPIDEINTAYEAEREEAENWADGSPVESEAQMKEVDALRKALREWRIALERGQKSAAAPLYDAYTAERDRWKPTIEDAKRIEKALVATVDQFKRKLADQKQAEERAKWAAAEAARREAEERAREAAESDLDAQREIAAAREAAMALEVEAQKARRDKVSGMRSVTRHEVISHREALRWIVANDRDAVEGFVDEYVRRNHKATQIDGVRVWQEKEAF